VSREQENGESLGLSVFRTTPPLPLLAPFRSPPTQGGLNTKGLAFDWVAGFMEKWEFDPGMKSVRGNPSERMLET